MRSDNELSPEGTCAAAPRRTCLIQLVGMDALDTDVSERVGALAPVEGQTVWITAEVQLAQPHHRPETTQAPRAGRHFPIQARGGLELTRPRWAEDAHVSAGWARRLCGLLQALTSLRWRIIFCVSNARIPKYSLTNDYALLLISYYLLRYLKETVHFPQHVILCEITVL